MKTIYLALFAAALAATAFVFSPGATAQPPAAPPPAAVDALITEITAQQAKLDENMTTMEASLAEVAEELRLARIFVSRGGRGPSN